MEAGDVDVVVLTWNDHDVLRPCLASVEDSAEVDIRLFVFDNGSEPPALVTSDSHTIAVREEVNLGTTAPRNRMAAAGSSPFICFLDSDARLGTNTLAALIEPMFDDPSIVATAPVFADQEPTTSAGRHPGIIRKLMRFLAIENTYVPTSSQLSKARQWDVEFAISACLVVRRSAFEAIDGFDESFFSAPEDLDLCVRLRKAGGRIVQLPNAICEHTPRRRTRSAFSAQGFDHMTSYIRFLLKR